jgi:hypothetical protein
VSWCEEVGIKTESLLSKRRFWAFMEWIKENPAEREKLVKTGWKRWKQKWRKEAFKRSG